MHELSIAVSLLEMIEEEAARRGGVRVEAVHLKLGPLSGVIREALESAYELASEGTDLQACRLVVHEVPILAHCPTCEANRQIESIQEMSCPVCGTPTPDIISGRELEMTAMEILDEQPNAIG